MVAAELAVAIPLTDPGWSFTQRSERVAEIARRANTLAKHYWAPTLYIDWTGLGEPVLDPIRNTEMPATPSASRSTAPESTWTSIVRTGRSLDVVDATGRHRPMCAAVLRRRLRVRRHQRPDLAVP